MTNATVNRRSLRTSASGSERLVLAGALLGFFMITLDTTAVNVALSAIGRSVGGATDGLQWVVDGYTVPLAALLISAGAVADRAGARRVFGLGLTAFTIASLVCGVAPALWVLILARVAQGGAAAAMLPAELSLVRQTFADPKRRARAVAAWSAGGASAMAAGPVVGGLLTSALGWRSIFFVNLPIGLIALVLAARAPRSPRLAAPLDPAGQVTAMLGLGALSFGVISGGSAGFTRPTTLAAFAVAVCAFAGFVLAESKVARPMVPLPLLRQRSVAAAVGIGFSINAAFYGVAFLLSLYFQQVLGFSPVTAGLLFLPLTGLLAIANLGSARIALRFSHHVPVCVGLFVGTAGMLALAFTRGTLGMEIALVPMGTGVGFALPSLTFLLLDALPGPQAGLAGGLFNASRQTGGALAVALYGALVSGAFVSGPFVSGSLATGSFVTGSFVTGMRDSMLISAGLLAASTVVAVTVLRGSPKAASS